MDIKVSFYFFWGVGVKKIELLWNTRNYFLILIKLKKLYLFIGYMKKYGKKRIGLDDRVTGWISDQARMVRVMVKMEQSF
jgi:hypothetical protein